MLNSLAVRNLDLRRQFPPSRCKNQPHYRRLLLTARHAMGPTSPALAPFSYQTTVLNLLQGGCKHDHENPPSNSILMNRLRKSPNILFFRLIRQTHCTVDDQTAIVAKDIDQFFHIILDPLRTARAHEWSRNVAPKHITSPRSFLAFLRST